MTRRLVLLVVVSLGVLSLMLGLATVGAAMLPEFPSWTSILMDRESTYGWDVASAGDVNGDGFADVIVTGAYYKSEESESQEGKAWIFAGSADGLGTVAMWYFESNNPNALFGMSADTAGDVNGDGFADIVVGAPRYKEPDWPNTRGAVYVFHGSPDGPSTEPDSLFTTTVEHPGARVGNSVAGIGDIDGDGYDDIAVGAECYSIDDVVCRGAFFVYYGSPDGLADDPDIVPTSPDVGGYGWDLAAAGDVNGDGFADLIVGGVGYAGIDLEVEAAHLYLGSEDGIEPLPDWSLVSDQPPPAGVGRSVAGAGDVNGDGHADIIVGDSAYRIDDELGGGAAAYYGGPVDADDDNTDDDTQDDDGDDDAGDDDGDDDTGGSLDDDDIPDTHGSRGDSLVQDDDGPCGC